MGGDDFSNTPWQHLLGFNPGIGFPFMLFRAEVMDLHKFPYTT